MSNAKSSRVHARRVAELSRPIIGGLVATCLLLASGAANANLVYQENFDGLTTGRTQPFPGAAGQGGWYSALAQGSAFGEIQNTIANPGLALHEFAPLTNPASLQTIDSRDFSAVSVGGSPFISLSFDFYAHTSDLDTVNSFLAALEARGGPDPGFQILGVDLGAGNGTAKRLTGLNVSLGAFNGVDNNDPIPLTVGQGLAFDTWHRVSVSLDQSTDRYIAITVDGQTQDLSAFLPERSFPNGQALRGELIENLVASIIPDDVGGTQTNDDVYWDNIQLRALTVPEPSSMSMLVLGLLGVFGFAKVAPGQRRSSE